MKKLFIFIVAVFVFAGCTSEPVVEVEDENLFEENVDQITLEFQEEKDGHEEGFFYVEPPEDFTLVERGRFYDDNHDNYAEFESSDGTVSFAVYSPLWYGKGAPIMPNEDVESETEREEKTSMMTESEIGSNANKIDTYITVIAHDKSYWRSIVNTIYEKDGSKTQRAFSFKYKDQESYDKYLDDYEKFKDSLIQHADDRADFPLDDLPGEISDKGYTHLADTQINESQTYKYEIYTDKGRSCTSGYLNDNVPIHCLFRIIDLSNEDVIAEFESDEKAIFESNGGFFTPPTSWYDDELILMEWGFGDAGIGSSAAETYNIFTEEFTQIYQSSLSTSIGNLITINDKQLLFHYPRLTSESPQSKIVVYEILEPMDDVWGMYIDEDQTEIDFSKGEIINELPNGSWARYIVGKGIVVHMKMESDEDVPDYIYDIEKNEFIPYEI